MALTYISNYKAIIIKIPNICWDNMTGLSTNTVPTHMGNIKSHAGK